MQFDSYTVQSGDTLFRIAEAFYGDGNKWRLIYAANRNVIANPDVIQIGWELAIPPENWVPPTGGGGGGGGGGTGMLRRGSKGAAVRALQQNLAALGYSLAIDGDFGPGTDSAVRDVQANNGLTVDGVAGPATLATIAELLQNGEGDEEEEEEDSAEDEEDEEEEGEDEEDESGDEEDESGDEEDEGGDEEDAGEDE